ncbi:capsule biosynthesis protein [Pseudooceanicola atlanticus]|uniref:Capsule biosynthesis protein n=2 Tax=Pseudooceanicola atlanticus TaxID=1461694 RepID=A0A0A0E9K0_9RHOB|nr:capsule biosynthesis protein [Pseudooceanicola atlanticus]
MTQTAAPSLSAVPRARIRPRHVMVAASFVVLVILPTILAGWYLWTRAADRYISRVGFSVRTEELGSAIEMLGGIAELSGSSTNDTAILYSFIQSQELVEDANRALDLRALWTKGNPDVDPIFVYQPPGTIEDLVDYWGNMVKVYDDETGLLELHVQAFTAEDAQRIARFIYDQSSEMINRLSAIAREDATRYAREELDEAEERLKNAREALTRFRNETQIVDPSASVQSQMGLLSSLQMQLAQALIDLDIQRQTSPDSDPRITQFERKIQVIQTRIAEEREKLGFSGGEAATGRTEAFADLVGEFERLSVEREFAEQAYTAARAAYDASVAEARRQSRYLAAHVRPTLAESAERPMRLTILALTVLFSFLSWAILVLAAYALRDRR